MQTNKKLRAEPVFTHEGAPASRNVTPAEQLRRAVMSCLLWEDEFYEDGVTIADRVKALVPQVPADVVAAYALAARTDMKLRHVPLLLVREMARGPASHRLLVAATLEAVIQRADELAEFLAIYWKDGRQPVSAQVKKGLARAFRKFNEHQLAKYDRDNAVKLRDALFISHARPADAPARQYTKVERAAKKRVALSPGEKLFKRITERELVTPDTWEVALSGGADKRATFERLIAEDKLGALALLRNLRGMLESGVEVEVIRQAIIKMDVTRVLPHRFIAAARAAPVLEPYLEEPMLQAARELPPLAGETALLLDVSGSMDDKLSERGEMTRLDAACGLAIIAREMCQAVRVFTFSNAVVEIGARRGFALRDAIVASLPHQSTYLGNAVDLLNIQVKHDRLIVITDEQAHDQVPPPVVRRAYMLNVASNRNGVGYGTWNKIDGFSEAVLRYIVEVEL